jgi:hypothetical protein
LGVTAINERPDDPIRIDFPGTDKAGELRKQARGLLSEHGEISIDRVKGLALVALALRPSRNFVD